ncbi:KilA-N domain-containing protein [Oryzomicrobium sp.]|uniref:KilA-N domain-containing protein n=1 Tax=Oryzomicrobium sp. TaxID=1911578 RepID=UPI0025E3DD8E|nr:KilA-N domain-containing protein [Oryzomicrobium sp.]MCE1243796.1 KilA-N domain-containing protein [Oryzomicrobium sp.]
MTNQLITIDNITIRQDSEGRYCLNDLHRAAGGLEKDKPGNWLMLDKTVKLADLAGSTAGIPAISSKAGRYGGTFAVRELVYAYATWINEGFYLKVLRFFDRGVTQGVAVADHAAADLLKNPLKYLEAIIGQAKELQARLEVVEPKAAVFDATVAVRKVTLGDFARRPT